MADITTSTSSGFVIIWAKHYTNYTTRSVTGPFPSRAAAHNYTMRVRALYSGGPELKWNIVHLGTPRSDISATETEEGS